MDPDDSKSFNSVGSKSLSDAVDGIARKFPAFVQGTGHFAQGRQVSKIADYTNAELADMRTGLQIVVGEPYSACM